MPPAPDAARPLYSVELDARTPRTPFFPENSVPMRSMLINSANINGDGLKPYYIAQAILKAHPSIHFLVPTQASFNALDDPRSVNAWNARYDRVMGGSSIT